MAIVYAIACDIHSSYHYQNKERIHLTYKGYKFEIAKETAVYKHTSYWQISELKEKNSTN